MLKLIATRLIGLVPLLFIVTFLTFFLLSVTPGDPASTLCGTDCTTEQLEAKRAELGIDKPLVTQYVTWLGNALQGDLGKSYFSSQGVSDSIISRFPATLSVTICATVTGTLLGVGLGILSALRPNGLIDRTVTFASSLSQAAPGFLIAIYLVLLFAIIWHIFPATGYVPLTESPYEWFRHLFLPTIALSIAPAAGLSRQTRASLARTVNQDYIRTANAKGLPTRRIMVRHALRNALIPVVTVVGLQVAALLGGALLVERVFAIPGLGALALSGVQQRDIPVIQGFVLFTAVVIVLVNTAIDIIYGFVNPKVRPS